MLQIELVIDPFCTAKETFQTIIADVLERFDKPTKVTIKRNIYSSPEILKVSSYSSDTHGIYLSKNPPPAEVPEISNRNIRTMAVPHSKRNAKVSLPEEMIVIKMWVPPEKFLADFDCINYVTKPQKL